MTSKRLISFDVGIKNMAYCIFDINAENAFNIVEWKVLNLCPSEDPLLVCDEMLKSKKICGKKAKYKKGEKCVCEKHAKSSNVLMISQKEHSLTFLKKHSVDKIQEIFKKQFPFETVATKPKMIERLDSFYKEKSWQPIKQTKTNASTTDLITIGRALYTQLSQNPIMSTVTHVIIENQISPIANRMKTLQGMLAQHFISLNVCTIEFVSSGNKLKHFAQQSTATTEYQKHKKDAVFYCQMHLGKMNSEQWQNHFNTYSNKKDDLADCFLQGLWYLQEKSKK